MRKKLGRCIDLVHAGEPPLAEGRCVLEQRFAALPEHKSGALESLIDALKAEGALQNDSDESRARLCLDEALVNALMHGSGYDGEKSVNVAAYISAETWTIRVDDEGAGFRDEDLPDPDAPENLLEEGGRGVHLIRSIMSNVSYWRGGRTLLMVQRRTPAARKSGAALPGTPDAKENTKASGRKKKAPRRKRAS